MCFLSNFATCPTKPVLSSVRRVNRLSPDPNTNEHPLTVHDVVSCLVPDKSISRSQNLPTL